MEGAELGKKIPYSWVVNAQEDRLNRLDTHVGRLAILITEKLGTVRFAVRIRLKFRKYSDIMRMEMNPRTYDKTTPDAIDENPEKFG